MASKNVGNITGANGSYRPTIHNVNTGKQDLAGPAFAKPSDKFQEVSPDRTTAAERMEAVRKKKKKVAKGDVNSPVSEPIKNVDVEHNGTADENLTD